MAPNIYDIYLRLNLQMSLTHYKLINKVLSLIAVYNKTILKLQFRIQIIVQSMRSY